MSRVVFVPFIEQERGLIERLLAESYATLLDQLPAEKVEELLSSWREYDVAVFAEPETVGACGFCSYLDGEVIGFASWNPTGWPEFGEIGHNCILPLYRCRGHGERQVKEILRRFTEAGFRKAKVRTDEHPFFAPARRMYSKCGFIEAARYRGELSEEYATIEYERKLGTS